ncbi:MAG: glutamine synthetase, partial [Alphaproteobacteria bacterium]
TKPIDVSAYERAHALPRYLPDALDGFRASKPLREVLGEEFVEVLIAVKRAEHDAYQRVISSWEREFLLLNV